MGQHTPFNFKNLDDLEKKVRELELGIRTSQNTSILNSALRIGTLKLPNRIIIHPMEGCDGHENGQPSELTIRRYKRFGQSGAGLCWFEATAVNKEARANPRQLILTEENKNHFQNLLEVYQQEADELYSQTHLESFHNPITVLQLTHSGRYSAPGYKNPLRMYWYDVLDKAFGRSREDGRILSDEELDELPELYEKSVSLAKEIGFNGVDIKSCHRYLLSESFSAFTRENSKYGGESYENRTRLLKNIIKRVQKYASEDFLITLRFNIFDAIPYPYGWGMKKIEDLDSNSFSNRSPVPEPNLHEPINLLNDLYKMGIKIANLTMANPYFNPFVSRPYDIAVKNASKPKEHPLQGVDRFISLSQEVRKNVPKEMKLVGTGYSWLQHLGGYIAAREIEDGNIDLVGWGRMAFANPTFAKQLITSGIIDKKKSCITCSKCTELMRMHSVAGCALKDKEVYLPYLKGEKSIDWK